MKNRKFLIACSIVLFWLVFVYVPHLARLVKKVDGPVLLVMKNVEMSDFSEGILDRKVFSDVYTRDMEKETGTFERFTAEIYSRSGEVIAISEKALEDSRHSVYTLVGDVNVKRDDDVLKTDRIIYREAVEEIVAPGPVMIVQPGHITTANSMIAYPRTEKWYLRGSVEIRILENSR